MPNILEYMIRKPLPPGEIEFLYGLSLEIKLLLNFIKEMKSGTLLTGKN